MGWNKADIRSRALSLQGQKNFEEIDWSKDKGVAMKLFVVKTDLPRRGVVGDYLWVCESKPDMLALWMWEGHAFNCMWTFKTLQPHIENGDVVEIDPKDATDWVRSQISNCPSPYAFCA